MPNSIKVQHKNQTLNIHYVDEGSGPIIVILHGWMHSTKVWSKVIRKLQTQYRVVCPDLPGFGKSQTPEVCSDNLSCTTSIMDTTIQSLTKGEKIYAVIGHSTGGIITHRLIQEHSIDPQCVVFTGVPIEGIKSMQTLTTFTKTNEQLLNMGKKLSAKNPTLLRIAALATVKKYHHATKEIIQSIHDGDAKWSSYLAKEVVRQTNLASVKPIKGKCMVCRGDSEWIANKNDSLQFAKKLDAEYVEFDHCSHTPMIECTELYAKTIMEFLK